MQVTAQTKVLASLLSRAQVVKSCLCVDVFCSIWWQFIPYFLTGVGEVFCNIGTMELFYTQVGTSPWALSKTVCLHLAPNHLL